MNRSILIVICDFLLVSLLVFSTPDTTKITGETGAAAVPASEQATNAPSGGKDLAMVMRTALTEEQQKREQLQSELEKTRHYSLQLVYAFGRFYHLDGEYLLLGYQLLL